MKSIFSYLFFLFSIVTFAQINEQDSLVNVKAFWNKDDVKTYNFTTKETKKFQDDLNQEEISYVVNIKVEGVYGDERTISWTYNDVKFNSDKFINNPLSLVDEITIKFVIDGDGRFVKFTNLDEVVASFITSSEKAQNEYLDFPDNLKKISDLVKQYASEEHIVKLFEKDIKQYHLFFGYGEFKPEETKVEFTSYMDNLFSASPTPAKTIFKLTEIGISGTNYIMNSFQEADKEWLANSWFNYLKMLADKLETEQPDPIHLQDEITYNVKTSSRINENGWLSFSKETKKVQFQDTDYTLERRIELK